MSPAGVGEIDAGDLYDVPMDRTGSDEVVGAAEDEVPLRRRVLVLLNPRAGRRRTLERARRRIAEHSSLSLELIVPDPSDHAAQMSRARRAVGEGVDAVVVRGGDGMVGAGFALAAEGAEGDRAVPLGVVPAGTGNDFARAAGLARHDPRKALDVVLRALESPSMSTSEVDALRLLVTVDQGVREERWVANSVNIGFDAQVNRRAEVLRVLPGPLRYLAALLVEVRRFRPISFDVAVEDAAFRARRSALICVQNGPTIGGGIPLAPSADVADGRAEVSFVDPLSRAGLMGLFPLVYLRAHRLIRPLRTSRVRGLRVRVPAGVPIFADGEEVLGGQHRGCEAEVVVAPGAVRLLR